METNTVQLTVTDLSEIRTIIDLACTRGAFRANEMSRVGEIYDRLEVFISAILEQASRSQNQGEEND